eukprot:476553-Amorphochlora_amoeboformis.AAC.1
MIEERKIEEGWKGREEIRTKKEERERKRKGKREKGRVREKREKTERYVEEYWSKQKGQIERGDRDGRERVERDDIKEEKRRVMTKRRYVREGNRKRDNEANESKETVIVCPNVFNMKIKCTR